MTDEQTAGVAKADRRPQTLQRNWGWLLALGILWMLLGLIAIIVPFAATVAAEVVFGAILAVGGVAQIIQAFSHGDGRGFLLQLLLGFLALAAGALLLFYPLQGVLTLTLVLAAFFVIDGVLRIGWTFGEHASSGRGWILSSGALSVLIGALIWIGWPSTAVWAIGLLVGIEFIFAGWSMASLAMSARAGMAQTS